MLVKPDNPLLCSLGDFLRAGLRPKTPLARAVIVTLCVKLVVILSLRAYMLAGEPQPPVDAVAVAHLIGAGPR
jgi:hypothetical protein